MANQAKYILMVPTHDNLGNELKDLATVAHHWLFIGPLGVEGSRIEGPVRGNWRDDPQETFNNLVIVGEDTPEMDSHIKQVAVQIAELANQWALHVEKENGKQIQAWNITNPKYQHGQPADPSALAQKSEGAPEGAPMFASRYLRDP